MNFPNETTEDYLFESANGPVRMSQLFQRGNTLVAYNFMYGPKMPKPCPMCTYGGESPDVAGWRTGASSRDRVADFARWQSAPTIPRPRGCAG